MTRSIDANAHSQPEVWHPFVEGLRVFVAKRVPAREVDDVFQDVLLRLHRAAPALRDHQRAAAWAHQIARSAIADYYRQRGAASQAACVTDEMRDPAARPPENLTAYAGDHEVHEEVLSWLRPMAEQLPVPYRRALVMADFEGYTQRQIAEALGLSLSGAKSRVQRARRLLAGRLRACCAVEFNPDGRAVAFRRLAAKPQRSCRGRCAEQSRG